MIFLLLITSLILIIGIYVSIRSKNIHIWLLGWLIRNKPTIKDKPCHLVFCFVDHYEPHLGNATIDDARRRVDEWVIKYPPMALDHLDADGNHPKHTFFFPIEEYQEEHINKLVGLCQQGFGEIDIHLHHDNDTSDNLRQTLTDFSNLLVDKHAALPVHPDTGKPMYTFIHGNWCLDNSRPDGRWCGVNDELIVLKETGCYADFTFPSAPSDTQTKKINSIYYATDDPEKSKSHDTGADVCVGGEPEGDLMLIQGPLALNFKKRKFGFMPKIENGDIRSSSPPTSERIDLWVKQHIHVKGRPEWVFVKIHTHGCNDKDSGALLGKPVNDMFQYLEDKYNDGENFILHYVSAREMYNIVKAAEAGEEENPNLYRDYVVPKPAMLDQE